MLSPRLGLGNSAKSWRQIAGEMARFFPPGHSSIQTMISLAEARRRTKPGSYASWEEIQKAGFVVVGSPATVRDRLKQIAAETGLGTLVPNFSIGNVPHHLTRKSMELFAREVMPALRDMNVDEPEGSA